MLNGFYFFLCLCLCNGSLDPQYEGLLRAIAQEEAALMDLNELQFYAPVAELREGKEKEKPPPNPNLNNTRFCPVTTWMQLNATRVDEGDYEMLGYLVAGKEIDGPMQCTIVCVKEAIFIAPVGCIATAKTAYTSVIYKRELLQVANFIIPSNGSKQTFDDIGIITVVVPANNNIQWFGATMKGLNRSDLTYNWFHAAFPPEPTVNVVGYIRDIDRSSSTPQLYAVDKMYASNTLCNRIITGRASVSDDYWVPCVHSCTVTQHSQSDIDCYRCNFGPGHAVMDAQKRLIGLISWSCGNEQVHLIARRLLPMPLGVTVPNSKAYREALRCANAIINRVDSYQHQIICDNITSSFIDNGY